ncbi:MAG: S-adenosylmethionine decarboxylase [Candidatus Paceibacterota bacterium]
MILKQTIKPKEIKFLQDKQALYVFDFRALGESMDYDIPAMWKYENLMPWIIERGYAVVNELHKEIHYPSENKLLVVRKGKDARISVARKLRKKKISAGIKSLWVAAPHPDADQLAEQKNMTINYTYSDFLFRNDKIKQKGLLKKMTPAWKIVRNKKELDILRKNRKAGFIKRKLGSGGYTVFDIGKIAGNEGFVRLFLQASDEWYFEEFAKGETYSVQCLIDKESDDVIVFGYSKQHMAEGKCFIGSEILSLESLEDDIFVQLKKGIKLMSPLLNNYVGFFGIDFIVGKEGRVDILEFNIRTTAVTVPTLLSNNTGSHAFYEEDLPMDKIKNEDIILTEDSDSKCVDIFRLYPNKQELGVSFSLDLKNCGNMPKAMGDEDIETVASLIGVSLSDVVSSMVKNFWPFGWTLCFILEESHCVLSGWYLEKRLTVDVFCCNTKVEDKQFEESLADIFRPESITVNRKIIR